MRAEVRREFNDLAANRLRKPGEVFTCSRERFGEISAKLPGYVAEAEPKAARGKAKEPRNK